jgi:hypothetical protein
MRQFHRETLANSECRLPKHRGQSWLWVVEHDEEYARWVLENIEDLDEDVRESLEYLLQ